MPGTIDSTVERKRDQQGKPDKDDPDGAMKGTGANAPTKSDASSTKQDETERKSPRESDE